MTRSLPRKKLSDCRKESGKIPITWLGENRNILLLPVHFSGDSTVYYLQFDTGSPYTLFYAGAIKNIKGIATSNERGKATFYLGNTTVTSDKFRIIDNGESSDKNDSLKLSVHWEQIFLKTEKQLSASKKIILF